MGQTAFVFPLYRITIYIYIYIYIERERERQQKRVIKRESDRPDVMYTMIAVFGHVLNVIVTARVAN